MRPRALAVAIVAGAAFAAAGIYGRVTTDVPTSTKFPSALCGSERWTVKTLTDPAASRIDFAGVKDTNVEALRRLNVPFRLKATSLRRLGAERTVYRFTARVMAMKISSGQ